MRRMPIEAAEQVELALPELVDLFQDRRNNGIRLRLEDFENDPDLLYNCVWYAVSLGKWVRVEPTRESYRRH
jgi:hypothetical protein